MSNGASLECAHLSQVSAPLVELAWPVVSLQCVHLLGTHAEDEDIYMSTQYIAKDEMRTCPHFHMFTWSTIMPKMYMLPCQHVHLVDSHAEDEDIVVSDLLLDLDVCPVERADGERPIELHRYRAWTTKFCLNNPKKTHH